MFLKWPNSSIHTWIIPNLSSFCHQKFCWLKKWLSKLKSLFFRGSFSQPTSESKLVGEPDYSRGGFMVRWQPTPSPFYLPPCSLRLLSPTSTQPENQGSTGWHAGLKQGQTYKRKAFPRAYFTQNCIVCWPVWSSDICKGNGCSSQKLRFIAFGDVLCSFWQLWPENATFGTLCSSSSTCVAPMAGGRGRAFLSFLISAHIHPPQPPASDW